MAFCTKCGTRLAATDRFCPHCGTAQITAAANASSRLTVMLNSIGVCDATDATILLEQLLGYSASDAALIVSNAPIVVAQNLNDSQAAAVAEALAQYGMEVTVYDETGYRTVNTSYGAVYDATGALVSSAAAILGAIGAANRVTRTMIRRYDYPFGRPPMFHRCMPAPRPPRPRRMAPPPPIGGPRAPRPAPHPRHVGPAPRPMVPGPMAPGPHPVGPGPRPAPSPRPAGPGRGPGGRGPGGRGPGGRGPGGF